MNRALVEVVLVASEAPEENIQRLRALLAELPAPQRVLLLTDCPTLQSQLQAAFPRVAHWRRLCGKPEVATLNKALLLCTHNMLLSLPHGLNIPPCCAQLLEVMAQMPHASMVLPAVFYGKLPAERLPQNAHDVAVVGSEISLALIRHDVWHLVGGLNRQLTHLGAALNDWLMRAQALGFVGLRANHAWLQLSDSTPVSPQEHAWLAARHPTYLPLKKRSDNDVTMGLAQAHIDSAQRGLRVCMDLRYLAPQAFNGTGVYALELVKALLQHTPVRLVFLVATREQRASLHAFGLPCYLEGQQVPQMHVLHRPAQVFTAADLLFLLQANVPFVVTYQDLIAYRASALFKSAADFEQYRLFSHFTVQAAQKIIAISADNQRDIIQTLHVAPEQVSLVHHGVAQKFFKSKQNSRNQACLATLNVRQAYFLYVGSDYAHKNLRLLLAAYALLRYRAAPRQPIPELLLVGHPSGAPQSIYPHLRHGNVPGVRFFEGVGNETLRALYQHALALVYPSSYEGFGMPLLEAMAAGCPVICSNYTSLPEVVGDAAHRLEPLTHSTLAAALQRMAADSAWRQAHIKRGLQHIRQFSWEQTAQQTYAVYAAALHTPTPHSLHARRMALLAVERILGQEAHFEHLKQRLNQPARAS